MSRNNKGKAVTKVAATTLDAALVNAMIKATEEILVTMANSSITVKNILPLKDYAPIGDISGVISIHGDRGKGVVILSFPVRLANLIVGRLLGSKPDSVSSSDRCDGIGELANMVSGRVKTTLAQENNATYSLSLPSIIQGQGHDIATRPRSVPYLKLTFDLEGHEFFLQMAFNIE